MSTFGWDFPGSPGRAGLLCSLVSENESPVTTMNRIWKVDVVGTTGKEIKPHSFLRKFRFLNSFLSMRLAQKANGAIKATKYSGAPPPPGEQLFFNPTP